MSESNLGERTFIERREAAAEKSMQAAADLRLAAGALRYVIDEGNPAALAAISADAGLELTDFDPLIGASVTTGDAAQREQDIAGYLQQDADLYRQLP